MKTLFFLIFLFSARALAKPEDRVGDYIKFKYQIDGKTSFKKSEILQYQSKTNSYLIRETSTAAGEEASIEDHWSLAKYVYTPEQGQKDLAECTRSSGKLGTYSVEGESYPVCRKDWYVNSYDLIGSFPIEGRAVVVNYDDVNLIAELIAFHWANEGKNGDR